MNLKNIATIVIILWYTTTSFSQWNIIDGISGQWQPLTSINTSISRYNTLHPELIKPLSPMHLSPSLDFGVSYTRFSLSNEVIYHYSLQSSNGLSVLQGNGGSKKIKLTHTVHSISWMIHSNFQKWAVGTGIQYGRIVYEWKNETQNNRPPPYLTGLNQWWMRADIRYRLFNTGYLNVSLSPFFNYPIQSYSTEAITDALGVQPTASEKEFIYGISLFFANGPQE